MMNLARGRTTLAYSSLLAAGSLALAGRDDAGRLEWLRWASTNLDNLQHHPVPALVLSAFLAEDHAGLWVGLALVGLGSAERVLGPARTAALVAAGHLVGTAVSEGILAYRVQAGDLPDQARRIIDVGPSFVVVSGLLAAAALGPLWTRIICASCFALLAPSLFDGLTALDVAAVGHLCAALIGAGGGWALGRARSPAPTRSARPRPGPTG